MGRCFAMVLAMWCVSFTARAETAFMMEPQAEERIDKDVRARVLKVTVDALRSEGFTVRTAEEAVRAGVSCGEAACVVDTSNKLHADFGVKLTLMATPGEDTLGSLGLAFYQRDSLVYRAKSVRVLDNGIQRAVYDALRSVKDRRRRGAGPWLVVTGSAAQVELWLEGRLAYSGALPAAIKVAPDRQYVVTVKCVGEPGKDYTISVGPDRAASYDLELTFGPARSENL